MQPDVVVNDDTIAVGEIPRWHADEGVLYWADIMENTLFRYDPGNGEHRRVSGADVARGISIQDDGGVLLSGAGMGLSVWKDETLETLREGTPGETTFNDSMVDPEGRLYGSLMAKQDENENVLRAGCVCRIDLDGSTQIVSGDIGAPNGIMMRGDDRAIYVADNSCATVWAFDYDRASGNLDNQRAFIELSEGTPDGMATDADGNLWLTACGGGYVGCYDQDGKLIRKVDFPVSAITAADFGGETLETLYVTSLGGIWRSGPDDLSGCLFAVDAGVKGRPRHPSRIHP
jgi:D-xylonolactonase